MIAILSAIVVTFLRHPDHLGAASAVETTLRGISNPTTAEQLRLPVSFAHFLPPGIKGLVCVGVTIGGTRDLISFFHHMHHKRIDVRDDGTVEAPPPNY